MILFWCLCVSLFLIGLALRRQAWAALDDLRLHLFGVRVRAPRSPHPSERRLPPGGSGEGVPVWPAAPPSRFGFLPPFPVATTARGATRQGA